MYKYTVSIPSFNIYLLSSYYMPGTILGTEVSAEFLCRDDSFTLLHVPLSALYLKLPPPLAWQLHQPI